MIGCEYENNLYVVLTLVEWLSVMQGPRFNFASGISQRVSKTKDVIG